MVHVNKCIEMSTKLGVQIWTRKRTVKEEPCEGWKGLCIVVGRQARRFLDDILALLRYRHWQHRDLPVHWQHRDLPVHLYNNNTQISVQLLYVVLTLVTSEWGVGQELVPHHHLQWLSCWMDDYCGQWIGNWCDKKAMDIYNKCSSTQTVCTYCSDHCDQSSLISHSH